MDLLKSRVYSRSKLNIKKAFLFIDYLPGNEDLYNCLQKLGCLEIFKPTLTINKKSGVKIKGNVDAELVFHTMIEYDNYHQAASP